MSLSSRPVQPVPPESMELVFFYRCPGCGRRNPLIAPTQPSMTRCESCGEPFPVMPVDERTRQPFGILHGGASLALAETVAGLGSMILCKPDEIVVGMQVSGNHISSAHEGDTVRAVATIVHKGRSSHVWNVDVFTSTAKLVSSVRVVNSILKKG